MLRFLRRRYLENQVKVYSVEFEEMEKILQQYANMIKGTVIYKDMLDKKNNYFQRDLPLGEITKNAIKKFNKKYTTVIHSQLALADGTQNMFYLLEEGPCIIRSYGLLPEQDMQIFFTIPLEELV